MTTKLKQWLLIGAALYTLVYLISEWANWDAVATILFASPTVAILLVGLCVLTVFVVSLVFTGMDRLFFEIYLLGYRVPNRKLYSNWALNGAPWESEGRTISRKRKAHFRATQRRAA